MYETTEKTQEGVKKVNWNNTLLLSAFFGQLGVDRFCMGHIGLGILKLVLWVVTFGVGSIIWWLIDFILILRKKKFKNVEWIVNGKKYVLISEIVLGIFLGFVVVSVASIGFILFMATFGGGDELTYYDNGNLKKNISINKDGQGTMIYYHENGNKEGKGREILRIDI